MQGEIRQHELADYSDGVSAMEIDMLIGLDYYWEFATDRMSRGRSGPIAIPTPILSGTVTFTEPGQSSVSLIMTHTLRVRAYGDIGQHSAILLGVGVIGDQRV